MDEQVQGEQTKLPEVIYEPDYVIEDALFDKPFVVLKAVNGGRPAWWNGDGGRGKVERLIGAFKSEHTRFQACIVAGITLDSFKYFCSVHKDFKDIRSRCAEALVLMAKGILPSDVISKGGFAVRKWILENKEPLRYGRKEIVPLAPIDAVEKISGSAFLDEEGNVIASQQTTESIRKNGSNNN